MIDASEWLESCFSARTGGNVSNPVSENAGVTTWEARRERIVLAAPRVHEQPSPDHRHAATPVDGRQREKEQPHDNG